VLALITVKPTNGKLNPEAINYVLKDYTLRPHVVKPKMVYISNATEIGSIYTKKELIQLSTFCKANDLLLFMDGARLGNALMAEKNDLSLADISNLTDVFYIGGTKNGALFGEAIIFKNSELAPDFDYILKQKGALLAKGRFLGIQFLELFKNDLYFYLANHANKMANKIVAAMKDCNYLFMNDPVTNQIFPILHKEIIKHLENKYIFYQWKQIDLENVAIRIITSWATDENIVNEFITDLKEVSSFYK